MLVLKVQKLEEFSDGLSGCEYEKTGRKLVVFILISISHATLETRLIFDPQAVNTGLYTLVILAKELDI